jgi:hypothetical protein
MKWSYEPAPIQDIQEVIKVILHYAVRVAGIALLVMVITGGFIYLTSGGDPKKTEQGSKYITYAIVGLALILGAWFILRLIATFTGLPGLLNFEIVNSSP